MIPERAGEAFEGDMKLTVAGAQLQAGQPAPDFALEYLDPADSAVKTVRLADSVGKVRLLNVVNSLDTPVCHIETRKWEGLRAKMPADACVYTISMDLPFAQARWQAAEGVAHQSLSCHRSEQFGQDYGVLLKEWRLLQRAVFVIDRKNRLVYAEYVADQMHEPNYDAAMAAVRKALANA
jgi:thiol peroxidase